MTFRQVKCFLSVGQAALTHVMIGQTVTPFLKRAIPGCCLIVMLALAACAGVPITGGNPTPTPTTPKTLPGGITPPAISSNPLLNKNWITNGDAEAAPGSPDDGSLVTIPGWTRQGNFNVMQYQSDDSSYQGTQSAGPSARGKNFFYGGAEDGTDNTVTSATQLIDVSAIAPLLTSNQVKFTLSGWLGGFSDQDDNAKLTIQFLSVTGQALGSASLGPVMSADRSGNTSLVSRSTSGSVPAGTVKVKVTLTMTKTAGADNDGSADNLSLMFHA